MTTTSDINLAESAPHFAERGYVVIDDALDHEFALQFLSQAVIGRNLPWHHRKGTSSEGGDSNYQVLDGDHITARHGWLIEWYRAMRYMVEGVVGTELETSPHRRSAVNIKYYSAHTGCQGFHYDTNPITGLVWLTDFGAPTVLTDLKGERVEIHPHAGSMMILGGKRLLHGVPAGETDQSRVTVVMNYYHRGRTDRPDWIDRAIYENVDPVVA